MSLGCACSTSASCSAYPTTHKVNQEGESDKTEINTLHCLMDNISPTFEESVWLAEGHAQAWNVLHESLARLGAFDCDDIARPQTVNQQLMRRIDHTRAHRMQHANAPLRAVCAIQEVNKAFVRVAKLDQ